MSCMQAIPVSLGNCSEYFSNESIDRDSLGEFVDTGLPFLCDNTGPWFLMYARVSIARADLGNSLVVWQGHCPLFSLLLSALQGAKYILANVY
jgi:hypothetical protein